MECNGGIPWNTAFLDRPVFFVLSSIVEIGKTTHKSHGLWGCADVNWGGRIHQPQPQPQPWLKDIKTYPLGSIISYDIPSRTGSIYNHCQEILINDYIHIQLDFSQWIKVTIIVHQKSGRDFVLRQECLRIPRNAYRGTAEAFGFDEAAWLLP